MNLLEVLVVLAVFAPLAWWVEGRKTGSAKWISLLALIIATVKFAQVLIAEPLLLSRYIEQSRVAWIQAFNIDFAVGADSLSVMLIALSLLLGFVCVAIAWREIQQRVGFFYFNLLLSLAGILGVFLATDLFLFFFFWEVMLLPMTAMIAIWGHEQRIFASIKFFIYTQASSLLMLIAIIALAFEYQSSFGQLSFNYFELLDLSFSDNVAFYWMLGFFIAFAVKLPSFPFHGWLPDAHTQAPTAGSVLLAGVLLKTGAYGLIRFVIPLFPEASVEFAYVACSIGVVSIIYGAIMALSQTDFKRLVAYSSISHMGFVMLALFSFNGLAYKGAIVTILAHGLSSAALFCMAGIVYARLHSRQLPDMGGLWASAPRMGGMLLAFVAAAFGLPGLANFVGEFLTLLGAFKVYPFLTILAALGLIGSALYGMYLFQSSFQGPATKKIRDLDWREMSVMGMLLVALLVLGLYPQPVFNWIESIAFITQLQPVAEGVSEGAGL